MCDTCNKIKELAEQTLGECIGTLRAVVQSKDPDYKAVLEAADHELPALIGTGSEDIDAVIEKRATGQPIDDAVTIHEVLCNCEFDYDDERNVAINDGKLFLLVKIFDLLGDEEHKSEAYDWVYQD